MRRHLATLAVLATAVSLLAACSGAPRPQALKVGEHKSTRAGDGVTNGTGATVPGAVNPDDTPANGAGGPGGGTAGGGSTGPGGAGGRTGTSSGGGSTGTGGTSKSNVPQPGDATLFTAAQNRRGITDSSIYFCGHAALIFAQAFDTRPEDINVYWDYLNKHGKLFGREVHADYFDDRYDGPAAEQAAKDCAAKNPFFILGGIGFDQIPNVRLWAESAHELYIHHIAVGAGADNLQYSFTMQPTVEETGTAFGQYISAHHGSEKIGIIYRDSGNWEPGRSAAKAVMKARHVNIVQEAAVQKNQSAYGSQILAMQQAQAQVVFLWENALGAAEFIKQAHNQGYHPTFVVFPFQTSLDLLGDDAMKSKIEGVSTWPAYKPGGYHDGSATAHEYDAEIGRFEAAMSELRGGVKPNDILWQVWLGNKQLHDMFRLCGQDCTRNRFAGLMLNGYNTTIEPNCPVDFRPGNHHRGARNFMVLEAYRPADHPYFKTTQWCSTSLG